MLVVVGGHSRNIGKTSVVAGLIRRLRDRKWTAVKITQYGHGVCSNEGEVLRVLHRARASVRHQRRVRAQPTPIRAAFSPRARSAPSGCARPRANSPAPPAPLQKILKQSENVIVESNSVVELVQPDVFLMVLDFACEDFKASSLRFMDRADAFIVIDRGINGPLWDDLARGLWDRQAAIPGQAAALRHGRTRLVRGRGQFP